MWAYEAEDTLHDALKLSSKTLELLAALTLRAVAPLRLIYIGVSALIC